MNATIRRLLDDVISAMPDDMAFSIKDNDLLWLFEWLDSRVKKIEVWPLER